MREIVDYKNELFEISKQIRNDNNTNMQQKQLIPSITRFLMIKQEEKIFNGAARAEKIIQLCTSIPGYTLSYFQRHCLDLIMGVIAPIIFKGCSAQELAEYMEKTRKKATKQRMMFLQTSRRSGKTDIITIVAAACLVVIPNLEMIAWSLYNETSELFGETVVRWLQDWGYGNCYRKSKSRVRFFTDDPRDFRVLRLLGSKNPHVKYIYLSL
jgi:hypothetical protein